MPPSCALFGRICNRCTDCVAMETLCKCVAEPSGNPPGLPHAARMPHTHTTHAGEDCPHRRENGCACCVRRSISSILRGVVTRTRNVSEYMLVPAVCLVLYGNAYKQAAQKICLAHIFILLALTLCGFLKD